MMNSAKKSIQIQNREPGFMILLCKDMNPIKALFGKALFDSSSEPEELENMASSGSKFISRREKNDSL
jgi:hypothetical protein